VKLRGGGQLLVGSWCPGWADVGGAPSSDGGVCDRALFFCPKSARWFRGVTRGTGRSAELVQVGGVVGKLVGEVEGGGKRERRTAWVRW